VSGQIGTPGATLAWTELQQLATEQVETVDIQDPHRTARTRFRGIVVRDLLERFAAEPAAAEITFVAIDGFRSTIAAEDARRHRVLLALEADGAPIPQEKGGPLYLIFPFSEAPELRSRYPDRFWSFYVTHVIVGTEPPALTIGDRVLDRARLEQLPAVRLDTRVGWKVEWPADVVRLRGVRLVDAIAAAGQRVPDRGRIVIRGKAPVHASRERPIALSSDALERCQPLLALRWGPTEQPLSAKLGGPIALAVSATCGQDEAWVTFVETITVEAAP
jgi:hypothetical protein